MDDFLRFFNQQRKTIPMHMEIYYSSIVDWDIHVWIDHGESKEEILNIQDCDMELCFARAQVSLKEWLLANKGGY